jgi:hypothetical protein
MTQQEHAEISDRLEKRAREAQGVCETILGARPGPYSATGMASGYGREAIHSEINRLTGRIEQLKALDRCLPKELTPMAEDAVRALVLGSVR